MTKKEHTTVMLYEAVDGLNINPDGIYLDGTFGRGGHSRLILSKLSEKGRLFAIDRDPRAIEDAKTIDDPRFQIIYGKFSDALSLLQDYGVVGKIDGILLDLGVSSPQLDEATRGFSFMRDGPLDMRMDTEKGITAAEWLNTAPEEEIARVLWEYGEEKMSRKIARIIVNDRKETPYVTTMQLSNMLARVVGSKEKGKNPATRTFQAIRIHINGELDEIKKILEDSDEILADNGRLSIISFHSLEDRIVKNFMRLAEKGPSVPRGLPITEESLQKDRKFTIISKPIKPSDDEIENNPRSRSAVLRIAQRVARWQ
jgi:16S rRNA (cytosine1402-N4)-methyltransferase